jgi:hypothetical protein
MTISTKTWIASGLVLAALVAVAMLPLSASAADRQEVSFEISGIPCGVTIADGSPPVVRTTKSVCGLASGTGSGLCCEGGADFDYIVNVAQMRGAVAGTWAISGNIDDVIWQGELRGSVGPDGAAGVLSGHANTGWTLHGTWRYDGFSDPTADTGGGFEATAIVSS